MYYDGGHIAVMFVIESEVEVKVLVYNQIQQKVYQTHSAVYSLKKKHLISMYNNLQCTCILSNRKHTRRQDTERNVGRGPRTPQLHHVPLPLQRQTRR